MISNMYDLNEFISQTTDKSFADIILMANNEATEAERAYYRNGQDVARDQSRQYAEALKDFVAFMRYGVQRSSLSIVKPQHLMQLRQISQQRSALLH